MSIKLETTWQIDCTPEEMRLILKALGGRLKPEDVEAAKKLGDSFTLERAGLARNLHDNMRQHVSNIGNSNGG